MKGARKRSAAKAAAPSSLTIPFETAQVERLQEVLEALGLETLEPPQHALLAARQDGVRAVLYASGKLLLQGKRAAELEQELAAFELVPGKRVAPKARDNEIEHACTLGSDECGKGDFFGPLVVAACRLERDAAAVLMELGVEDSKRLSDRRILELAAEVARRSEHEVIAISPERYNALYERFGNLNHLLAWAHGKAIERVLERSPCDHVVIDRFARDDRVIERALGPLGRRAKVTQRPRAEDEPAVAAASLLARARFVRDLDRLSKQAGLTLPKGAAPQVERAGRALVERLGPQALGRFAKLHFRTAKRVLGTAK